MSAKKAFVAGITDQDGSYSVELSFNAAAARGVVLSPRSDHAWFSQEVVFLCLGALGGTGDMSH